MLTVEGLIAGCRDVVTLHETLSEILRALEHGTSLRRTYHRHVFGARVVLQVVVDTLYQRVFRTYHHHVDALLCHELLDGLEIIGLHGDVLAAVRGARVARGDIQFLTLVALSDFPC